MFRSVHSRRPSFSPIPTRRAYWMDVVVDGFGVLAAAFVAAWPHGGC